MNARRPDGNGSRDLVPVPPDGARAVPVEPVVGDYYGRPQRTSAIAHAYVQLLRRQRWTIAFIFLLVVVGGTAFVLTRPRLYRSRAEMIVTPVDRGGGQGNNLADTIGTMTRVRSVATEVRMLSSQDLLDEAFAVLPDDVRERGFGTTDLRLSNYPVVIGNPKDTDVVTVEVTARDPEAASAYANGILQTSQERRQETIRALAAESTQHVDAELKKVEEDLQTTTASLASFKQQHGVVDVSAKVSAEAQALANLESQANQGRVDMERAREMKAMLSKELGNTPEVVTANRVTQDNPIIHEIEGEIEELSREKARLVQEYLPNAPEIRAVDNQIADARKRLEKAINSKTESVTTARNPVIDGLVNSYINAIVTEKASQTQMEVNQQNAEALRQRIAGLPEAEQRIALMNSRISELQNTHSYLTGQKQSLNLAMYGGLPSVMPFTNARPGDMPVSPNIPASLALTLVLAGLLAVGVAVLRDQLNDRIHTADMLETLTGRRVLGALPQVRNGVRGLVTAAGSPAALFEHFRILRGNILLSSLEPLPRTIMVSSPQAGDGKSTVVANLAATIAVSGKRVLVIDCDLRHPSVHVAYILSNSTGLSSILQGEATLEACVRRTEVDGLDVLTAGPTPANPPELLASPAMAELLAEVADRYDCVLLDSTPLVNLSDGTVLAALADGVLLVVSSDRTRHPELQTAMRNLEQVGATLIGLVYNRDMEARALSWQGQ